MLHIAAHPESFPRQDLRVDVEEFSRPGRKHAGFEYYRAFNQDIKDNEVLAKTALTIPVLAIGGEKTAGAAEADFIRPFASNVIGAVVPDRNS